LAQGQAECTIRFMIVIAHNIRSLHNVGSIFRAAAAFGVKKLYLTGVTGQPPRKEIAKVALGAEHLVPWQAGEFEVVIADLRQAGYRIVALETGGQSLVEYTRPDKLALVLGNEVEGLEVTELALMDDRVTIPMAAKQSLNVSVATGVALYHLQCIRSLAG
jgi:23S rRNA (guanosine2251-2'-O)-methyltransferase